MYFTSGNTINQWCLCNETICTFNITDANVHADKEKGRINLIKYFLCNVDAPRKKNFMAPFLTDKNVNQQNRNLSQRIASKRKKYK